MDKKLKHTLNKLFAKTPKQTSVGFGKKVVNGVRMNEGAIIFTVPKKKPLSELKPSQILPSEVKVGEKVYSTDVVELPPATFTACDSSTIEQCLDNLNDRSFWYLNNPNRGWEEQCIRPGHSVQVNRRNTETAATLGSLVVDKGTGCLVGVTNQHVVTPKPLATSEILSENNVYRSHLLFQEGATFGIPFNKYNTSTLSVPFNKSIWTKAASDNNVDAACISIDKQLVDVNKSWIPVGLEDIITTPPPFATTEELDNILDEQGNSTVQLALSCTRTGVKKPGFCEVIPYVMGMIVTVSNGVGNSTVYWEDKTGWNYPNVSRFFTFKNVLAIQRPNSDCEVTKGGDSGSPVYGNFNGTWKLIGLNFAGSSNTSYVQRIDIIAENLQIEAWDGTSKPFLARETHLPYYVEGTTNQHWFDYNGHRYWQAGFSVNAYDIPRAMQGDKGGEIPTPSTTPTLISNFDFDNWDNVNFKVEDTLPNDGGVGYPALISTDQPAQSGLDATAPPASTPGNIDATTYIPPDGSGGGDFRFYTVDPGGAYSGNQKLIHYYTNNTSPNKFWLEDISFGYWFRVPTQGLSSGSYDSRILTSHVNSWYSSVGGGRGGYQVDLRKEGESWKIGFKDTSPSDPVIDGVGGGVMTIDIPLQYNTWHHLVITRKGRSGDLSNLTINPGVGAYFDGQLVKKFLKGNDYKYPILEASSVYNNSFLTPYPIIISGNGRWSGGLKYDIQVAKTWSGVLSSTNVLSEYNTTKGKFQ